MELKCKQDLEELLKRLLPEKIVIILYRILFKENLVLYYLDEEIFLGNFLILK